MNRIKFIVDMNVGKLAPWLRALGYDVVFVNPISDSELVEIALSENRILLTKDTGIMKRRVVASGRLRALLIEGKDWRKQLVQVVHKLKLKTDSRFTRCLKCNTPLETCLRSELKSDVPALVYRTQDSFLWCPTCLKNYWQGSHWRRMTATLDTLLTGK